MGFTLKLFFLFLYPYLFSSSKLPTLATKQDISKIRFISSNGKFTYYQNKKGQLLFSTNYKTEIALQLQSGTIYGLRASPSKRWILVSAHETYHHTYSPLAPLKIYKINFGQKTSSLTGEGIDPQLHLQDEWASWFDALKKKIHFTNLDKKGLSFSISLSSVKNPYFIPQVLMLDNNKILYTDINEKGLPGILLYNISLKKSSLFQKFEDPNIKIELCQKNKNIYIGRFGLDATNRASFIREVTLKNFDYTHSTLIYESKKNDLGQMVCTLSQNFLYFVKDVSSNNILTYEAVRLDIKSKKIKVISDLSFVTQIIEMDGHLLAPYNGVYKVLLGESNTTKFDLLEDKGEKK